MVNVIAEIFPFAGGEEMVYYHPSPVEKYFPVAPGIEVSAEPYIDSRKEDKPLDTILYNGRGILNRSSRKGDLVDTYR
jgi:hypothetical protein